MNELVAGWQLVPPLSAVAFAWHAQPSGQQSPGLPARSARSVAAPQQVYTFHCYSVQQHTKHGMVPCAGRLKAACCMVRRQLLIYT